MRVPSPAARQVPQPTQPASTPPPTTSKDLPATTHTAGAGAAPSGGTTASSAPTGAPPNANPPDTAAAARAGAQSRRGLAELSGQVRSAAVREAPSQGSSAVAPSLAEVRAGRASLERGQRGPAVQHAQQRLGTHGYDAPTDGRFGPSTERAVQRFQADRALPESGRVDSPTLNALDGADVSGGADSLATAGRRETNVAAAERATHGVYARHGDTPHRLSDPAAVALLIRRSPQVDGNRATTTDLSTCGGAAQLNALLLDGGHAANARAIRDVASSMAAPGTAGAAAMLAPPATSSELAALGSMERGTLTPRQANQLQGLLNRMTDSVHPSERDASDGTSAAEVASMTGRLRRAGAYANTDEMTIRSERIPNPAGPDGYHWTVSSRARGGETMTADSWPETDGHASLRSGGDAGAAFRAGSAPPANFEAEVCLRRESDGAVYTSMLARSHNPEGRVAGMPADGFVGAELVDGGAAGRRSRELSYSEEGSPRTPTTLRR